MGISVFPAASGGVTQKVSTFTSTGTFTVPSNCSTIEVFLVGGGGGAGGVTTSTTAGNAQGAGGGGGGCVRKAILSVTPGASYTVTIGAGGAGGTSGAAGSVGGDSSFGALLTALGGGAGSGRANTTGNDGTSRGTGGGSYAGNNVQYVGGAGGGAGGNATAYNATTTPFTGTFPGNAVYTISPRGSGSTPGIGGAGSIGSNQGGQAFMLAGIGVDGYGAGGLGGFPANSATNNSIVSGYSGVTWNIVTSQGTAVAGGSGQSNSGNGGDGGAAVSGGTVLTGNGGSGGSGFCRVVYWS